MMTSQSPKIYTYKITFEEVPYYYYGVKKEKYFNEEYWGSPVTHKWCWELYTPKKQILQVFPYTNEGWLEAQEVEKRLIQPVFNTDKWCLNESCGGNISLECLIRSGNKTKELGVGVHGITPEKMTENGKKGGNKIKELGLGIHRLTPEQIAENSKKGGNKTKELGIGIHGLTSEQRSENGKKFGKMGGIKSKELGVGVHGRTPEQHSEDSKKGGKKGGKKTNAQKWMCLETGFVTNPGNLTKYQMKRDIDTTKRIRIL